MACYEMRPPSGGEFNNGEARGPIGQGFSKRRALQLQRQSRVKEERIVELETENALFHLKLAEYQERIGRSHREATWFSALLCKQQHWPSSAHPALVQLCHLIQKLKQDVKDFRSSFLGLWSSWQAQYQEHLSDMAAAVQRAQLGTESLQACQSEVHRLQLSLKEMDMCYHLEKQKRRELHNTVVELKGNIRVHCRIHPLLPLDTELGNPDSQNGSVSREVAHPVDEETILVQCDRPGHPLINKTYNFERVYGPAEPQTAVFADVCPLLTSLLDGLISENPSGSPNVDVSIVEVYNNDIFDLLAKHNSTVLSGVKGEVVTTQDGWTEVPLLTHRVVTSVLEFVELIHGGLQLRERNPTLVHADSSRSHLIITVTLTAATSLASTDQQPGQILPGKRRTGTGKRWSPAQQASPEPIPMEPAGNMKQVWSTLQLVDLAGSECAGVSGVTGLALRETSFINRSLSALADVLAALSERRGHIPYRNSKLTHLLQDSIGGDAKLLVILCVSSGQKHVVETLQSLEFGTRARQVKQGRVRKKPPHSQRRELCLSSA
ncbi:kinesin-like protein KIF25 [Fukomys damarensis]|uniref:kinesin-like protein KIF25 n=1 Tax=Fukomys damarensis TaxID=885580 RepID=UPI0008FED0E8|nr:kinesin-like protein KIF25 [Fukomys damarensis]